MRFALLVAAFAGLVLASPARAEVAEASPSAILIRAESEVSASPDRAWRALTNVGRWWSSAHTYSGDAANLRLESRAGGCWCERWGDGQVEHMRVVLVMEREGVRTLRLQGGLGPLQEMGAMGILTFTVTPREGGAKVTMIYRVSGDAALALDHIAPAIDGVLMEQFSRLTRYADGGALR